MGGHSVIAGQSENPGIHEIVVALKKVLASEQFRTSRTQRKLLRFVAQQALTNRPVKQADIAVELYGTVDQDSNKVKATANLVRIKLAKYYREEGRDDTVRIELPPGPGYRPRFSYNAAAASVRHYNKGLKYQRDFSFNSIERSGKSLLDALELEPRKPLYLSALSETTLVYAIWKDIFDVRASTGIDRHDAATYAAKAKEFDPKRGWHSDLIIGVSLLLDFNGKDAARYIGLALSANEKATQSSYLYMLVLAMTGRIQEAFEYAQAHLIDDPFEIGANLVAQFGYYLNRDYENAMACHEYTVYPGGSFNDISALLEGLTWLALGKGSFADTCFSAISCEEIYPGGDLAFPTLRTPIHSVKRVPGLVIASSADYNGEKPARTHFKELLEEFAKPISFWAELVSEIEEIEPIPARPRSLQMAIAHMAVGDTGRALAYLRRAYKERSIAVAFLPVMPLFDPLRNHPRFKELISRYNDAVCLAFEKEITAR